MMAAGTETTILRRLAFPLILAASLIAVLLYYISIVPRFAAFTRNADGNLLATVQGAAPAGAAALSDARLIAADPLDQGMVNAVIAARARSTGDMGRALRDTGLLRQLGWRSSPALQNLLWRAGMTNDLPLLMDTLDAFLRREKLLGQIYPVLNLMTRDPTFRGLLIRRLANNPSWRRYYFMSASDLTRSQEIKGRYLVMLGIQRRGDALTRNEIAPILPKLIGIGQASEAFGLWRTHMGSEPSPLADTGFDVAVKPLPADALPVPFEWQLGSGTGYFVDVSHDDQGNFVSIDWNGRGAPVFASQITSARAGRYRLDVTGEAPMSAVAGKVGFQLVCGDGAKIDFDVVFAGPGRRMQLASAGPVPCDFSTLQLYGLVQPGTSSATNVLRSIRLERLRR